MSYRNRGCILTVFFFLIAFLRQTAGASTSPTPPSHVFELRSHGVWISPDSAPWSEAELSVLSETLNFLPKEYLELGRRISLVKDNDPKSHGEDTELLGSFSLGVKDLVITLYTAPYIGWLATTQPQVYYTALQRAFIHELTHALDHLRGISSRGEWKRLSGWQETSLFGIVPLFHTAKNEAPKGYAREYGKENPSEDFATYAEEFFLPVKHDDKERSLPCRTPSKFGFFSRLFPGFASPSASSSSECSPLKSWIDPNKVESLELLLASPSTLHPASFAGHILLRVRMRGAPVGDDPVLMFGMDGRGVKSAKDYILGGLAGRYPSQLDEVRLSDIVIKYTEGEDRDLFRYELTLSPEQRLAVLERFFEIKKNYTYKYKFFTSNCATMMVEQIGVALGSDRLVDLPGLFESPHTALAGIAQHGWQK